MISIDLKWIQNPQITKWIEQHGPRFEVLQIDPLRIRSSDHSELELDIPVLAVEFLGKTNCSRTPCGNGPPIFLFITYGGGSKHEAALWAKKQILVYPPKVFDTHTDISDTTGICIRHRDPLEPGVT